MAGSVNRPLATGRLVIGVPTVPRKPDYVLQTVDSLLAGIGPAAEDRVEIVVFDATHTPIRHAAISEIETRHREQLESGRLTIVRNLAGYPQLRDTEDAATAPAESPTRFAWRRKVVLDFAHLARFCADRGDYYLHVEDDTIAAPEFLAQLTSWFDGHFQTRNDWAFLTLFTSYRLADRQAIPLTDFFSACALLFRCADLPRVACYCEQHFARQALDFLLRDLARSEGKAVFARSPSLFQHVGLFSSCDDETRPIQATRFREGRVTMLARGFREAVDVLRRDPAAMPEFVRWRLAVLVPPLLPLVRVLRRVRAGPRKIELHFGRRR